MSFDIAFAISNAALKKHNIAMDGLSRMIMLTTLITADLGTHHRINKKCLQVVLARFSRCPNLT
jgi:hypothetical protein